MTVKALIEALNRLDPETDLMINGSDTAGYDICDTSDVVYMYRNSSGVFHLSATEYVTYYGSVLENRDKIIEKIRKWHRGQNEDIIWIWFPDQDLMEDGKRRQAK